jgi:hypothetical protein
MAILLLFWAAFGTFSIWLGSDASWDTRNYHIYNAFAALNGRIGRDLGPAQLQSYYVPWVDIVLFQLREALNDQPALLAFLMAFPSAVAALLATRIALRALPGQGVAKLVLVAGAVAIGATGAAGLPTTGSAMSEMAGGSFMLAGLLLLLGALHGDGPWRGVAGGALMGVAAGLKLTSAPFAVAALLAFAIVQPHGLPTRLRRTFWAACGVGAGVLVVGGPWWWNIYQQFGNPLFPTFNDIFRSPLYFPARMADMRFIPSGFAEALAYPFIWGFGWRHPVSETTLRDPRFTIVWLAVLGWAAAATFRRWRGGPRVHAVGNRPAIFLAIFFVVSFVLWEGVFSILRYLAPIELLSGVVVAAAVWGAIGDRGRPVLRYGLLAALALGTVRMTYFEDWGHVPLGTKVVDIDMPRLPADAIVLFLDKEPMGYLATARPARAALFLGANSNMIEPGDDNPLSRRLDAMVRDADGPLYGIEKRMAPAVEADLTLAHHGLERGEGCRPIRSNLEKPGVLLRICPLRHRTDTQAARPPQPGQAAPDAS